MVVTSKYHRHSPVSGNTLTNITSLKHEIIGRCGNSHHDCPHVSQIRVFCAFFGHST